MAEPKVLYAELTPGEFREKIAQAPIAYLPLGTLEWHGEHMPLGSDGIQSQGFFERLARRAGGIVLPMLFVGPDRMSKAGQGELYGMDICHSDHPYPSQQLAGSAYWMADATFGALLDGIMKQLHRAGFRIVVGHGHGPSTLFFRDRADEYHERHGLQCFNCWGSPWDKEALGIQVDHGGSNETSLVMAVRPELVQMDRLVKDPAEWPLAVGGRDPRTEACAETGEKAISLNLERMADILKKALADLTG